MVSCTSIQKCGSRFRSVLAGLALAGVVLAARSSLAQDPNAWGAAAAPAMVNPSWFGNEVPQLLPAPDAAYEMPALLGDIDFASALPPATSLGDEVLEYTRRSIVDSAVQQIVYRRSDGDDSTNGNANGNGSGGNGNGSQGSGGNGNGRSGGKDIGSGGVLGKAPANNDLVFLRRQAVLLKPGEKQFDIGVAYGILDTPLPVPIFDLGGNVIDVVPGRVRSRLLTVPMELRVGITERMQWFINAPVGWAGTEVSFVGAETFADVGGIGDVRTGASFLLRRGQCYSPDVIGTVVFTAPTGDYTNTVPGISNPTVGLGNGFWSLAANVLFIHTLDPVVIFYGGGYNHRFDRNFSGVNVDPGEEIDYQLGVGFAVTPRVTFSTSFQGAYITNQALDDVELQGTIFEPWRLRMACTVSGKCKIIEPFCEVPLTDQAMARVGITCTY